MRRLRTSQGGDTVSFIRKLELAKLVPQAPNSATVERLHRQLHHDRGFEVSLRTVQRDLQELAVVFDLDYSGTPPRWFRSNHHDKDGLPIHDTYTALTFCLVEDYLHRILPTNVTQSLAPIFAKARQLLKESEEDFDAKRWYRSVKILPRALELTPPVIDENVFRTVCEGLWHRDELYVTYQNRGDDEPKSMNLHPHGLVVRDGVMYLLATLKTYPDIRHLAIHRMLKAEATGRDAVIQADFHLADYIEEGHFAYLKGESLELVLHFDGYIGQHLLETPLNGSQHVKTLDDGRIEVRATVKDSQQLRWWVLGFGNGVEVVDPPDFRAWVKSQIQAMSDRYR